MNVTVGSWSRVYESVRERSKIFEPTDWQRAIWSGMKIGSLGIGFLFSTFQISHEFFIWPVILVCGLTIWYVLAKPVDPFWTPVGLTLGAFVMLVVGLPTMVIVARVLSVIYADRPVFVGWESSGWLTAAVGFTAFLPYGIRSAKKSWIQEKQRRWEKRVVLPWYFRGKALHENDVKVPVVERDRIAMYWASLLPETVEYYAKIVAKHTKTLEMTCLAELQHIHRRAILRTQTKRYRRRNS